MKLQKMGCDEDLVKCMVFWTNFILALVGISLISIGIIFKINLEEISEAIPQEYNNLPVLPILTISLGTSLIGLAIFGCYGCLTERIKYVILYIAILLLLFVIQLTIGISAFCKLGNGEVFKSRLEVKLEEVFRNYDLFRNISLIDLIQHRLKCCGLSGPNYWVNHVPRSCLKTDTNDIFRSSCNIEVYDYIISTQHVLGTSIIVLSLSEIIASVVSLFFVHYLKNQSRGFISVKDYSFENGVI